MKAAFKTAHGYQGDAMNLPVENLEAAIPYYETIMGFQVVSRGVEPYRSAVLGRDGTSDRSGREWRRPDTGWMFLRS